MEKSTSESATATLFYDGACPLCMTEMARLGRLKSDQLELADIHSLPPDTNLPDRDTLLRTLHLRRPDGTLLTGVDANIAAWSYTPYGKWLRWLRWPGLRLLVDRVYTRWARWRYERLYSRACSVERKR